MSMIWFLLASYVCGSIPFGLLIVRAVAGVDLRRVGSGNIGATNVGRVAGWRWAIVVLLLDAMKGAGPTWGGIVLADRFEWGVGASTVPVLAGAAAIVGHMFPVWLSFLGGKGVATALGVVLVLSPWGTLVAAGVFSVVFAATRIVSLGSILAAVTFAAYQLWGLRDDWWGTDRWALTAFSVGIPALIVVRHAGNIARLVRGEEKAYRAGGDKQGGRDALFHEASDTRT